MADAKRYYWLRLHDDFFDSKRIKKLRRIAGGDTYTIIYLKMQLKSIKHEGVLEFTGLEDNFADELALDIDENPDDVRMTLTYLINCGLCETSDNIQYFLPYAVTNTGSETASTQRSRDFRERKKALQCNKNATQVQQLCNVEIEKEKEIEIKIERDNKRFAPPTLEDVENYISEKGFDVDAKTFYDYFSEGNWTDSKGNKVKNWKQKLITWQNHNVKTAPARGTKPEVVDAKTSLSNLERIRRLTEEMKNEETQ